MLFYLLPYMISSEVLSFITIVDKGVSPLAKDSVAIQFYIDIENVDRQISCHVHTWTKRCCTTDYDREDCDIMYVYGINIDSVRPKDRETLIFVYPNIHQHDQVGYCDFVIDSECGNRAIHREVINVPFDTRISYSIKKKRELLSSYIGDQVKEDCETLDQDSLNECDRVNCDLKYSGGRPFYSERLNRCVAAEVCNGDPDRELPSIVIVPNSNVCRDLDNPLTVQDLYEISTGQVATASPVSDESLFRVEMTSNCSTISQNFNLLRDLMYGRLCPDRDGVTSDYSSCCKTAILKILLYIITISATLLLVVCLAYTSVCLHSKWRDGSLRTFWRSIISKFEKGKPKTRYNVSRVDVGVKNTLLREVIVKDIPIELRDSYIDVCGRMEREVRRKKRYRRSEMGSQVSLEGDMESVLGTSSTSTLDDCDEKERLLK